MSRKLTSIGALSDQLGTILSRQLPRMYRSVLEQVGETCETIAKNKIIGRITPLQQVGNYQPWEPLKDATIEQKARYGLGKEGDARSMLFATGALHESISFSVAFARKQTFVGTNNAYAAVHEYGSSHVPPRPFLGPSMVMTMEKLYAKFENQLCKTLDGSLTHYRR